MPFDPNTAVLEEANPERSKFDPSTAVREDRPSRADMLDQQREAQVQQANAEYGAAHPYATASNKIARDFSRDLATIPANFVNQLAMNYPRSAARTALKDNPDLKDNPVVSFMANPESDNPFAQVLSKTAGAAGAVYGLGPKLALGAANVGARMAPKVILPAAKMATGKLGQKLATGAVTGFAGGATYAPDTIAREEYAKQAALSTALGVMLPGVGRVISSQAQKYTSSPAQKLKAAINQNAAVYRKILRPNQGEVNKVEIKSGKKIDDYYRLAAEEGLIIKQTKDKKLDVSDALVKLQDRKLELNNQLNSALRSDRKKQFSLAKLGYEAAGELRKKYKNDTEYKKAVEDVYQYIGDAIEERGNNLTGSQLNDFKQGMWSVSYDPLSPNKNKVARQLGFLAKKEIEQAYSDKAIKETNRRLGDFLTLETLLNNAQGRVVQGGKLGGYAARGTGAVVGGLAGQAIPIPGVGPVAGSIAGQDIGGRIAAIINDPERITKGLAKRVQRTNTKPALGSKQIKGAMKKGISFIERTADEGEQIIRGKRGILF